MLVIVAVKGKGDWALGLMYQWVELQSLPDPDMSGIGNGNLLDQYVYSQGQGNTNFHGGRLEFLYAFTDNITVDTKFQGSSKIKRFPFTYFSEARHSYYEFKTEVIYAW